MRVATAFLTGLVLLWGSHAWAGTEKTSVHETDSADAVLVPCDMPESMYAPILIAQAEAPILLAQAAQCAANASTGACVSPGAQCGPKSNLGMCVTVPSKKVGKSNCQCMRTKQ